MKDFTAEEKQLFIYAQVAGRGYGPHQQGLDAEQFAGRQIAKLIEEALEALEAIGLPGYVTFFANERPRLEAAFKEMFDDKGAWQESIVNRAALIKELADVAMPLFCAATALNVDLLDLAAEKAASDTIRGVR